MNIGFLIDRQALSAPQGVEIFIEGGGLLPPTLPKVNLLLQISLCPVHKRAYTQDVYKRHFQIH